MGVEDLLKMKPRELQIFVATKVMQIHEEELPDIKKRLESGDEQLANHDGRLRYIEITNSVKREYGLNGIGTKKKVAIAIGGGGSLTATVVAAIAAFGRVLGWW